MSGILIAVIAILSLVPIVDQVTKWAVVNNMELYESIEIIPGVLNFTYITNDGAAFGKFDNVRWLFMILSTVAIIVIAVLMIKYRKKLDNLTMISLSMILSGGFSNMIDRTFYGKTIFNGEVIDFIDFCAFPKIWNYIFNIADSAVVVGTGLLIIAMIISEVKIYKAEKTKKKTDGTKNGDEMPPNE